jgi:hypothetical protein
MDYKETTTLIENIEIITALGLFVIDKKTPTGDRPIGASAGNSQTRSVQARPSLLIPH